MIKYDISIARFLMTNACTDYINTMFPISDAVFIPYIKEEFRVKKDMKEAGALNDRLIQEFISSLNANNYIGTINHANNFYSDYFESPDEFINVLYYEEGSELIIGAIFVTSKAK